MSGLIPITKTESRPLQIKEFGKVIGWFAAFCIISGVTGYYVAIIPSLIIALGYSVYLVVRQAINDNKKVKIKNPNPYGVFTKAIIYYLPVLGFLLVFFSGALILEGLADRLVVVAEKKTSKAIQEGYFQLEASINETQVVKGKKSWFDATWVLDNFKIKFMRISQRGFIAAEPIVKWFFLVIHFFMDLGTYLLYFSMAFVLSKSFGFVFCKCLLMQPGSEIIFKLP
jgi:hypothetical protein